MVRAYLEFGRQERGYYGLMFYREVAMPPNVLKLEEPAGECFDLVSRVLKKLTPRLALTNRSHRVVANMAISARNAAAQRNRDAHEKIGTGT